MTGKQFETFIDWRISQYMSSSKQEIKPKSFFGNLLNIIKRKTEGKNGRNKNLVKQQRGRGCS